MKSLSVFLVASLAVLGAILVAYGSFGWGLSLWLVAISLTQVSLLADVWTEYRRQDADAPSPPSLYAAFMTCVRRIA